MPFTYHTMKPQVLPIIFGTKSTPVSAPPSIASAHPAITNRAFASIHGSAIKKQNLTSSQRIKLLMHERCNHKNIETISRWIRQGLLPVDPSVAACPDPICTACQLGKAHRKSHASNKGYITDMCRQPGDGISADQLEAGHPGKIPTTKGLPTLKRSKNCNLWVNHHTRYIYPTFHETKHASKLNQSKKEFQSFAAKYSVTIRCIRADNGVYSAAPFQLACEQDNQNLSFCAVGGHWQNGVTEHHIGIVIHASCLAN